MNSYWRNVFREFFKRKQAILSTAIVALFCLVGIYAPFLASSKPLFVEYEGTWYFPLFRYLFFTGFYTKPIDLFFNLLIFTFPLMFITLFYNKRTLFFLTLTLQLTLFLTLLAYPLRDPASDPLLNKERQEALKQLNSPITWDFQLKYMPPYEKLSKLLRYYNLKTQQERFKKYQPHYEKDEEKLWLARTAREKRLELLRKGVPLEQIPSNSLLEKEILVSTTPEEKSSLLTMPTLYNMEQKRTQVEIDTLTAKLSALPQNSPERGNLKILVQSLLDKRAWYETESKKLHHIAMPLISHFHWQEDAGGEQNLNQFLDILDLTRINSKDLTAALIFGVRISLVVGILSIALALIIGIPIGALAGYFGGKTDIIVSRLLEIWESMPVFFMLLLVIAMLQSKSIIIIITVIGLFGWTGFSRYIRGEFFKQRNLLYVEACRAQGFNNSTIIFSQILPNALPPLLTLLPFAIMSAITSEAALSFLGLGEEGSSSWGVLMDEGRSAFPGESYLLWPPAVLLTVLLIAIALVGDSLRDALDPKLST